MILNARANSNHKLLLKLGHVRVDYKNDMGSALSRLSDICEANAINDHYEYKSFMKEHFHFMKFKVPKYTLEMFGVVTRFQFGELS